jgi:hypothetical protein
VIDDKFRAERLDEARARAGDLVALLDLLGQDVTAEDIERAALVPMSPAAMAACLNLGHMVLMNLDSLAAVLNGHCPAEWIATFANVAWPMSAPRVRPRRPRRPRPTAAERRAQAATAWLAGPAWEI